jgi:hypothetical protein
VERWFDNKRHRWWTKEVDRALTSSRPFEQLRKLFKHTRSPIVDIVFGGGAAARDPEADDEEGQEGKGRGARKGKRGRGK